MVINERLKLRFADRATEQLLASNPGSVSRSGFLVALGNSRQARLKRLAGRLIRGQAEIRRLFRTDAPPNDRLLATMYRLESERVAIVVTDPARSTRDFRSGLQQCFSLTRTEAELFDALIEGQSVRDFADSRSIGCEEDGAEND